jgi:hypothetical protein
MTTRLEALLLQLPIDGYASVSRAVSETLRWDRPASRTAYRMIGVTRPQSYRASHMTCPVKIPTPKERHTGHPRAGSDPVHSQDG